MLLPFSACLNRALFLVLDVLKWKWKTPTTPCTTMQASASGDRHPTYLLRHSMDSFPASPFILSLSVSELDLTPAVRAPRFESSAIQRTRILAVNGCGAASTLPNAPKRVALFYPSTHARLCPGT